MLSLTSYNSGIKRSPQEEIKFETIIDTVIVKPMNSQPVELIRLRQYQKMIREQQKIIKHEIKTN